MKKILKLTLLLVVVLISQLGISQQIDYNDSWGDHGFMLQNEDNANVIINFSLKSFTLSDLDLDGEQLKTIGVPGIFLPNDEGAPNLAGTGRFIAIPQGAIASLKVTASRTETLKDVSIAPAPRIPLDTDTGPIKYEKNQKIYSKNAFYPEEPVKLSAPTKLRGVDVVMLGVTPFQYNPVTKELIIYRDLKIEVTYQGGNGHVGEDRLRSRWWDPILLDVVLNPEVLPVIDYSKKTGSAKTPDYEYIIISPDDATFISWANQIKEWRQLQGIKTGIVTTAEIGGNTTTAIETYVNNAYNTWDIPPAAVLLLGDYGTTGSTVVSPIYNSYCVSDNIYADIDGNHLPDVVFARMTAQNATHLETMITKFLTYEQTPPTDPDFYNHPITALGWQTERWFQICSEVVGGFWKNVQGKNPVRVNAIYSGTPGTVWSTATNTSTVVNYFDNTGGLGYIPESPATLGGWSGGTAAMVNTALNAGAFALQHRDHGGETGWGEPAYSSSNIDGLTNVGKLSWIFSINCLTGKYNYASEVFAEKFHRYKYAGQNAGALGITAASEVSYSFVNDTYVWGMMDNLWPNFMPAYGTTPPSRDVLPAFGNAAGKIFLAASSWPYNPQNKEVTYHLFHHHGDAFSTVYSEVPQNLTVNHAAALLSGTTSFSVTANEGSFIALTVNGEIIGTANGTGSPVSVTIAPQNPGQDLVITVTKQNYFRYSSTIPIVPPTGPYIAYETHVINDAAGNNNGAADFGENITLDMTLKNLGSTSASSVNATLISSDSYITITDNSASYGTINAGAISTVNNAYAISVHSDVPDQHVVDFELSVSGNADETWISYFSIIVKAPILEPGTNLLFNDNAGGNGNGMLDPGETVIVTANVANNGHSTSPLANATLTSASPYVIINSGTANLGQIVFGNSVNAVFNITISPSTPVGQSVDLVFTVNSGNYGFVNTYYSSVGLVVEDFETGNFTKFPWTFSGNANWTIANTGQYEGLYCAKSGVINHSQQSDLQVTLQVAMNDDISFYRKVSSESGFDYLRFYIDGIQKEQQSGEVAWSQVSFPVTAGIHTFKWTYSKDGSVVSGSDAAWVDYIIFPPLAPIEPDISVNPLTIDFGNVIIGSTESEIFTITNNGASNLAGTVTSPDNFSVAEVTDNSDYKKGGDNTLSFTIPPAGNKQYYLIFSPTDPSCYSGMVQINSNDPDSPTVYIDASGCGIIGPDIAINPGQFTKSLTPDSQAGESLNIANNGGLPLDYTAQVIYNTDSKTAITVYPVNANYNTGTTTSTSKTYPSLVRAYPPSEAGWMKFDVSSIPDGATINSVEFHGFVNANNWPYWSITPVTNDPVTATASTLYSDIIAEGTTGYYLFRNESGTIANGWVTHILGGNVNTNLAAALSQNWFAIGIMDRDAGTYYINFDGWNEANKPYLVIDYTYVIPYSWLKVNGENSTSGTVPVGGNINVNVGFDASSLALGTYTANIQLSSNDPNPSVIMIPCTLNVVNGFNVDLTAMLEGTMTTTPLNLGGMIPLNQPFNMAPWNYSGTESVAAIPTGVVDWVLVELRDASTAANATAATRIARQAAFILSDGSIVGLDGSSILQFTNSINQQLFAVVHHRNHLAILSANALTGSAGVYNYDFTTGYNKTFGGMDGCKEVTPGIWGMMGGDSNCDGDINESDINLLWKPNAGEAGYRLEDFNLDGQVNNQDKDDCWQPNYGAECQVPE